MTKLIFMLLLLLQVNAVHSQTTKRDSLLRMIAKSPQDSSTVLNYLALVTMFEERMPDTAIHYANRAYSISKMIGYNSGIIQSLRSRANIFNLQGQFDSGLIYYQNALSVSREIKDSIKIATNLFSIGASYRKMADYKPAISYSLEAAKIIEAKGDKPLQARMNNGLQLLYYDLLNYDKAIVYGEKAVSLSRELKDVKLLVKSLSNLSMSYKDLQQLEKSKTLLIEALNLSKNNEDLYAQGAVLVNLAGVFLEQKDYPSVEYYSKESLLLHQQINSKDGECISLRGLAISYLHQKKYELAKETALNAYFIAKTNNYKLEEASSLKTLSQISFAMQDLANGQLYFDKSDDLYEGIYKESYQQSSAMYEKKYETEKKEKQIVVQAALLQKRKIINYVLIGSALTLLAIFLLAYRNYKHKQNIQRQRMIELETQQQLTAVEAILKGEEQERTRLAKDLHDGLGGMLSGIKFSFNSMKGNLIMTPDDKLAFERSIGMVDSSIKEMRRVAHNMMPESLVNFGLDTALKDFTTEINKSGALKISYQSLSLENTVIDHTTAIAIYRIVQELINNTMKHAQANSAVVQVTRTENVLSVTVEDDGKGFDTKILKVADGIGWKNIQNRVEFLKGSLDVESIPGGGTSVHFEINL